MNGTPALHLRRAGAPRENRRPLVLLHGWSCHGGFFAPQMEALAGDTLVLAPDLPGHGHSRDFRPRTIEAAADAVHALLVAEEVRDAVLVGWSMGALVAWSLIERHGEDRLGGLVVEDMSPKVLNAPGWSLGTLSGLDAARNRVFLRALVGQWPRLVAATARRCLAGDADPALVAWMEAGIRTADPRALSDMWASLTAQDFRDLAPRIRVPVLFAHGAKSQLYDAAVARWQQQRLKNARTVSFAGSGHAPHLEESTAFCQILRDMIEK